MKSKTIAACLHPMTITGTLVTLIGFCVVLYIYFVAASVLSVVMRQDAERAVVAARSEIATLETSLIAAQHEISSRLASEGAFARDKEKIFVERSVSDDVALSAVSTGN